MHSLIDLGISHVPQSHAEAMASDDAARWHEAQQYELAQLEKLGTYDIVDRPQGVNVVKNRWVFARKSDGRYRARLVAKGFTQQYGVDYTETFSPVARFKTLRFLLALAAQADWDMIGLDIKSAYLHGNLEEEIYMELPEGFPLPGDGNKVA